VDATELRDIVEMDTQLGLLVDDPHRLPAGFNRSDMDGHAPEMRTFALHSKGTPRPISPNICEIWSHIAAEKSLLAVPWTALLQNSEEHFAEVHQHGPINVDSGLRCQDAPCRAALNHCEVPACRLESKPSLHGYAVVLVHPQRVPEEIEAIAFSGNLLHRENLDPA